MNNIVILNAQNLSEYAFMELFNGKSAAEYAAEAASDMPEATKKAVIIPDESDGSEVFGGFELYKSAAVTPAGLIEILTSLSEGFDNIIYYHADCPLIDRSLTGKMYANHKKYFCEYTFADGYPAGVSVEIIKTAILPMLARLAENDQKPADRTAVFSLIEKDINAFEIETEISPDDQRLLRVALYPDTKRNYIQLKSISSEILPENAGNTAEAVLKTVRKRGEFLRSLPVFFEFETTAVHPQKVEYMPEPWKTGGRPETNEMGVEDFKAALKKIADFCGDAVISLSIRNEPAVHSAPAALAEAVLSYPGFSLLVETSGIGWNDDQLRRICSMDGNRITWIVDLDALDRQLYSELRGSADEYDEALSFAERMINEYPSNTWVQVVRMKKNETDTELFYKYWKEKTNNVIIQKYDWCCGRLEQLKVTDLSPVKRLPCWHIKREAAILADGTVPLCREDLDCEMKLGNIFTDDISEIWERGAKYYQQHLNEEYPGICRKCDEYYTYNY